MKKARDEDNESEEGGRESIDVLYSDHISLLARSTLLDSNTKRQRQTRRWRSKCEMGVMHWLMRCPVHGHVVLCSRAWFITPNTLREKGVILKFNRFEHTRNHQSHCFGVFLFLGPSVAHTFNIGTVGRETGEMVPKREQYYNWAISKQGHTEWPERERVRPYRKGETHLERKGRHRIDSHVVCKSKRNSTNWFDVIAMGEGRHVGGDCKERKGRQCDTDHAQRCDSILGRIIEE